MSVKVAAKGNDTQAVGCIGPVTIRLSGPAAYVSPLAAELQNADAAPSGGAGARIRIEAYHGNPGYEPSHYAGKDSLHFDDNSFFVNNNPHFCYRIDNAFGAAPLSATLYIKRATVPHQLYSHAARLINVGVYSASGYQLAEFSNYSFFWLFVSLALMKANAAFIHASALSIDGQGLLLSGTGGCGKTSTCMSFLERDAVGFMGEDFSIVDHEGRVWPSPKKISLYQSDVAHGSEYGSRAVADLALPVRWHWRVLTHVFGKNPQVKPAPQALFGDRFAQRPLPLANGVYLSRENVDALSLRPMECDDFSLRSARASVRELKTLLELLLLFNANAGPDSTYPTPALFEQQLEGHYRRAFADAACFHLRIPLRAAPYEIRDCLISELGLAC